jgi:hypothetical protein
VTVQPEDNVARQSRKRANGLVKLDAALDQKLEAAASNPERNRRRRFT